MENVLLCELTFYFVNLPLNYILLLFLISYSDRGMIIYFELATITFEYLFKDSENYLASVFIYHLKLLSYR